MAAPPTPLALASPLNACFQASKPPGPLPHCAASADPPDHATTATIANAAATNCLPLIIENSFFRRHTGRNRRSLSSAAHSRDPLIALPQFDLRGHRLAKIGMISGFHGRPTCTLRRAASAMAGAAAR